MSCRALPATKRFSQSQPPSAALPQPPVVLDVSGRDETAAITIADEAAVAQVAWQTGGSDESGAASSSTPSKPTAQPAVVTRPARIPTATSSKKKKKKSWVKPMAIISQLKTLDKNPILAPWSGDVQRLISMLLEESEVSSPQSATILAQLEMKILELDQITLEVGQQFSGTPAGESLVSQLRRLRYELTKRTSIWRVVQKLPATSKRIGDIQLVSREQLSFDFLDRSWQEYLQISDLQQEFSSLNADKSAKKKASRVTLARMASPALSDAQRNYLNQTVPASLVSSLKETASGDVDQYRLLKAIEWNEQKPSGVASNYINDQFQNLMWSQDPNRQAAAAQLQAHYRNANVRVAVSQRMLNRMIPDSPVVNEPVNEHVMGATIMGQSQIRNRLSVQLVEDPTRIALQLHTNGEVDSDTVAKKSGFEIRNAGNARFQAFKDLSFDRRGMFSSGSPIASAQARQRLVTMRSNLDSLPVVNWVARRLAKKKLAEQAPATNQLVERKIKESASLKLQQGVEEQVAQMKTALKAKVMEPLISMDLNPEALQLATTRNRIVMRYRLAGFDQMAADSPRPTDSEFDYLSLQLHQSLLNNIIQRVEIESQTFTPESLLKHLSDVVGLNPEKPIAKSKHEAEFVFANYDAIRVELLKGKVHIKLNLKSLRVGKGKTWRNITISSAYVPTIVGSQILLKQEGMIGVKGKKFRIGDQIAVRAIFEIVLPESYQFNTVPARLTDKLAGYTLVLSKLDIADGWAGLVYDEVPMHQAYPSMEGYSAAAYPTEAYPSEYYEYPQQYESQPQYHPHEANGTQNFSDGVIYQ